MLLAVCCPDSCSGEVAVGSGVQDGLKDRIGAFVQNTKPVPRVVPAATKDPVLVREKQCNCQLTCRRPSLPSPAAKVGELR